MIDLTCDSEDLSEPIDGGRIDVGEATAGQHALELDPFPPRADETFAALADAKVKLKKDP